MEEEGAGSVDGTGGGRLVAAADDDDDAGGGDAAAVAAMLKQTHTTQLEERKVMVRLRNEGMSLRDIARRIPRLDNASGYVSPSTVAAVCDLFQKYGSLEPRFQMDSYGGPAPKMLTVDLQVIVTLVAAKHDINVAREMLPLLRLLTGHAELTAAAVYKVMGDTVPFISRTRSSAGGLSRWTCRTWSSSAAG